MFLTGWKTGPCQVGTLATVQGDGLNLNDATNLITLHSLPLSPFYFVITRLMEYQNPWSVRHYRLMSES
jgi:hypothetical protein